MVAEIKLPPIDNKTKHRVIEYFTAIAKKFPVQVQYYRDGLPDGVKMVRVLSPKPESGDLGECYVNNAIAVPVVITYRKPESQEIDEILQLTIQTKTNFNADGISCGVKSEQFNFKGGDLSWLFGLATVE